MVTRATQSVPRRWNVDEYHRLGELGFLADQRTELIDGEIIVMPPRLEEHSFGVSKVARVLAAIYGPGYWVREEKPIRLSSGAEPEPDVSVSDVDLDGIVPAGPPGHPFLVVEIAVTTLKSDREKTGLYARSNIQEVWIVDVMGQRVEVYRDPEPYAGVPFGYRYRTVVEYGSDGEIVPLTAPAGSRPAMVKAMLPRLG